jgi:3-methyl-2-oxobutanoate hydroxymethyltransferase
MLTAYDFPTAKACDANGIDITLVGDSLAQVCLGYDSTVQLTMDEMVHHVKAVRRGTQHPLLVADMPFGSYGLSASHALANAVRLVKDAGADAVKLEGNTEILDIVRRMTEIGIPVMAHIGLLPQRHVAMSGYRVQGRGAEAAHAMVRSALALQEAGAFSMVLEAIPAPLGEYITRQLRIPTIGIGAGAGTSGQVLVWSDVMNTWQGHKAKFVRRFANVHGEAVKGVQGYAAAVRAGTFPDNKAEGYDMDLSEWERFLELEGKAS